MSTSNKVFCCFDQIHYWNSRLCPPIGLIANIGLIYLIINKTPKEMRIHSRILLQTCVIDIALLIVTIIGQPACFPLILISLNTFIGSVHFVDITTSSLFFMFEGLVNHWLPILSPLASIYTMRPYREFIFKKLFKIKMNTQKVTPVTILVQQNNKNGN
uniref:G_PROTEIN_RECEP_F1_2 domain-containing protein n=1 Tax=Meloidogyne hapla TaxID=6305 RepID=A0A1I8C1E4_MELHA